MPEAASRNRSVVEVLPVMRPLKFPLSPTYKTKAMLVREAAGSSRSRWRDMHEKTTDNHYYDPVNG